MLENANYGTARGTGVLVLTDAGWRISEANTDVPGGLNEASGLPPLVAPYLPGTRFAGDVAGCFAGATLAALPAGAHVALMHATAYADDRQVMTYLAGCLQQAGLSSRDASWR